MPRKMIPCFSRSVRMEWYTISESYWALTPARYFRSASGIPRRSNVFLMSGGTSSHDRSARSLGLM